MPIGSRKVVFAGTPDFAVPCLDALAAAGAEIPFVLTQPDRPAGRGRRLAAPPVKQAAERLGIAVRQPPTAADLAQLVAAADDRPDFLVVVAYGLILPQAVLDWPAVAALNVHASLLPRWRGAAPIQRALLAGDAETGISLMRMTRGLDEGPVYASRATPIGARETAGELHDRLSVLGAELLVAMLPDIAAGRVEPAPQSESGACYAPKLVKHEARIDWSEPAAVLERQVRAFVPWPVADATLTNGARLRIWSATALAEGRAAEPGRIVASGADGISVATGAGQLRLETVQPAGKRPMPAAAYLAAHPVDGLSFETGGAGA